MLRLTDLLQRRIVLEIAAEEGVEEKSRRRFESATSKTFSLCILVKAPLADLFHATALGLRLAVHTT